MGWGKRGDEAAGREAVGRLMRGLSASHVLGFEDPARWTALDHAVRDLGRYDSELADRLRTQPETALCHPDGRVRQAALATAGRTPAFWLLTVIRCADWVEPVRLRARRMLAEHLRAEPEAALRTLTPLVLRVGRRGLGVWARELFEEALRAAPHLALAQLGGFGRDTAARRLAARVVLDHGLLGVRELARHAADDLDPVLGRWWADAALAAMAAEGPDDEAVDILLSAHAPLVRSAGVTALRRAGRAHEAARHLADRSPLVRACARWLVSGNGGDPRAACTELCADPAALVPWALTGLAECGRREDAAVLRGFLTHPVAGVRAQAVAGLRLLQAVPQEDVRALLDDPSAAVARETARALLPFSRRMPAEELFERLSPELPAHTRRAAFRLLKAHGGVTQLRAAVLLLTDADPGVRRNAAATVQERRWLDELPYAELRADEGGLRAELEALLERCTHLFSDHVMNAMRGHLGVRA
ncbi:hypothetical protein AB0K02_06210 [Streptomyces sp. NPDC049597]|uniref:hypothetical protein n=1 Tax=Streptomyces sp. NPDC049597 TaxID=3155276 RepID=UPI003437347C